MDEPRKIVILAECLQGVGELSLARQQADTFASDGYQVMLVSGHDGKFMVSGNPLVQPVSLPPLRYNKETGGTEVRYPSSYMEIGEAGWHEVSSEIGRNLLAMRQQQIFDISNSADSIVVMSGWPFWLQVLDDEMTTLIDGNSQRESPIPITFVTREVGAPDSLPTIHGEAYIADMLNRDECAWLILGDRQLIPAHQTFDMVRLVGHDKIMHVGYPLEARPISHISGPEKRIFVSAGGGDFRQSSYDIINAVLNVIESGAVAANTQWDIIIPRKATNGGQHMADELRARAEALGQNVAVMDTMDIDHFNDELTRADLLISQGGAGTFGVITRGVNSLVIPISDHVKVRNGDSVLTVHFKEQNIRTQAFAEKGYCYMVPHAELEPARLAREINEALENPRIVCGKIKSGGMETVKRIIDARMNGASVDSIADLVERIC